MDSYLNQDVYPDWLAQDDDSTKPQGNGAEQAAPFFDLERLLVRPSLACPFSSPFLPGPGQHALSKRQTEKRLIPSLTN